MRTKSFALVIAPVLAAAWLAPAQASADEQSLAAGQYAASAHGDIVDLSTLTVLPTVIPGGGQLATVKVGHARATTDSAAAQRATAESANLDAALLGQGIPVDVVTATAPPSTGPTTRTLVPLPLAPLADIGLISGSVQATDAAPCVPAVNGVRTVSRASTTLAGATIGANDLTGYLAQVGASQTTATTQLVDNGHGSSDVESTVTTKVGDIRLLGGQVQVHVADPVTLRATSDGTTGTAAFDDPPTITAKVGGSTIPIPLNHQPVSIPVSLGIDLNDHGVRPDRPVLGRARQGHPRRPGPRRALGGPGTHHRRRARAGHGTDVGLGPGAHRRRGLRHRPERRPRRRRPHQRRGGRARHRPAQPGHRR